MAWKVEVVNLYLSKKVINFSLKSLKITHNIPYMGNTSFKETPPVNYQDVLSVSLRKHRALLITTLQQTEISVLIRGTIPLAKEEEVVNHFLSKDTSIPIFLYGTNNNDTKVFTKYEQLIGLGFKNVYVYLGGLFEWLLLNEIYGTDNFPVQGSELDLLKYAPKRGLIDVGVGDGVSGGVSVRSGGSGSGEDTITQKSLEF